MQKGTHLTDGREIVAREPAMMRPPNPNSKVTSVPATHVNRLLLVDKDGNESETYECGHPENPTCNYTNPNVLSVVSHHNGHVGGDPKPLYPEETLRKILRLCVRERAVSKSTYASKVAQILADQKVPSAKGVPWTGEMVSRLWNRWHEEYPVRAASGGRPRADSNGRVNGSSPGPAGELSELIDQAEAAILGLTRITQALRQLGAADPELAEKARRWDELQRLMKQ